MLGLHTESPGQTTLDSLESGQPGDFTTWNVCACVSYLPQLPALYFVTASSTKALMAASRLPRVKYGCEYATSFEVAVALRRRPSEPIGFPSGDTPKYCVTYGISFDCS